MAPRIAGQIRPDGHHPRKQKLQRPAQKPSQPLHPRSAHHLLLSICQKQSRRHPAHQLGFSRAGRSAPPAQRVQKRQHHRPHPQKRHGARAEQSAAHCDTAAKQPARTLRPSQHHRWARLR